MTSSSETSGPLRRTVLRTAGVAAVGLLAGCLGSGQSDVSPEPTVSEQVNAVTLYRSPTCACCHEYAGYLEGKLGSTVEVVNNADLSGIKAEYGIPENVQSCHTVDWGDYFVEGHVPYEVVQQLLAAEPAIAGIALPGMPSGSPGMPGEKTEAWQVYAVHEDGSVEEFTSF